MIASTTKLHISPLTPDILPAILGPRLCKIATNISYHTVQTFPENNYGYVVVPAMEAEKIKKKFNGAILKGKKVKIEEARPAKRKHVNESTEDAQSDDKNSEQPSKHRKKSKREHNVVSGHELSPDRTVKRGWTQTAAEKAGQKRKGKGDKSGSNMTIQATSKYSEKPELLFKTKVPQNKSIESKKNDKKRKTNNSGAEVVHEFENSTAMPSFLRSDTSSQISAVAYKDGEGWIDDDGNVVEAERDKASKRRKAARHGLEIEVKEVQPVRSLRKKVRESSPSRGEPNKGNSSNSSKGNGLGQTLHGDGKPSNQSNTAKPTSAEDPDTDETSSSGESESQSESESISEASSESGSASTKDSIVRSAEHTPPEPAVHPLEALFKKPAKPASSSATVSSQDVIKPSLEVQTSFSFFEHHDDNDGLPVMPMTPFSSQDLRRREVRSAAPTPDTAHPSRMSSIFNGEESEGELSEMSDDGQSHGTAAVGPRSGSQSLQIPETDFAKQFWEKRGENNRAWKARRRAVLKEKRQRENRARRPNNW